MIYDEKKIGNLHQLFLDSSGICTDTRKIKEDCFFVALVGDNFDGNEYVQEAFAKGAKYALLSDEQLTSDERCVIVEDTLLVLQQLANFHRKQLNIPILSITGSNGKTTTKELIASVLRKKFKTAFTFGNLNNHIGVPLTLLQFDDSIEFAIVEMGANHRSEIAQLCEITEPNYGLITNIGKAHIGEFGSAENIRLGKLEMYDFIKSTDGKMFFNTTDEKLSHAIEKYNGAVPFNTQFQGGQELSVIETEPTIVLELQSSKGVVSIPVEIGGIHNVENVKASIAVGLYFGLDPDEIKVALGEFRAPDNRSQWIESSNNNVFLDAYNANPSSVELAIEYFERIVADNKLVILGDMNELGAFSDQEHVAIYDKLKNSNVEFYLVGEKFAQACKTIHDVHVFAEKQELIEELDSRSLKGYSILIKASRGLQLETIVDSL